MAMSTADYFRMMQGGVDRTGYADMMPDDRDYNKESPEDRLAKLMAQSDEKDTLPEDIPPEETGELSFGSMFDDYIPESILNMPAEDMSKMDELAAMGIEAKFDANRGVKNVSTPKVSSTGVPKTGTVAIGKEFKPKSFSADLLKFFKKSPLGLALIPTELGAADFPLDDEGMPIYPDEFGMADGGRVGLNVGGQTQRGGLRGGRRGFGGPPDGGPDNNKNDLMGPSLDAPTIDPITTAYTPMEQPSLIDQVKKYNFLQGVYGDEEDGLSFGYDINPYAEEASAKLSYSFADGGRVGLQDGGQPMGSPGGAFPMWPQQPSSVYGLGSLLSGMQQSMGPTFRTADFRDSNNDGVDDRDQGMGISPSIPGNEKNPGMDIGEILASLQSGTPQAYTPYVSTMPLYDPSTLGTGLPSTAGGYDPYVSYDPYAPVGAFSRPPSNMDTPFGLTPEQIKEGFSDMDRFSLAAQEAKRKAAEEAARIAAEQKGPHPGGGGGPNSQ